jgi:hypothetical protein
MVFRLPSLLRSRRTPVTVTYAPHRDGKPDPGEVCWAWVTYEEDPSKGKDRPILVLAVSDGQVTALPLTSKDHDRDAAREARAGRFWIDIGSGDWDRERRPSEVRLSRILSLDINAVRCPDPSSSRSSLPHSRT